MKKIIWSPEAENDYEENINYLLKDWSIVDAQNFIDEVEATLILLQKFPEMYPLSTYKHVRKGVICKQISLLYRINHNNIELLRFWGTRQDPVKLKI